MVQHASFATLILLGFALPPLGRSVATTNGSDASNGTDATNGTDADGAYESSSRRRRWKRGIADSTAEKYLSKLKGSSVHWAYNWAMTSHDNSGYEKSGIHFYSMVWNGGSIKNLGQVWGHSALLGFNEPNMKGQANMSPEEAAKLWPHLEAAAKKHKITDLVGPALNYGDVSRWHNPTTWYDAFFKACHKCRVDAIAIHIYNCNLGAMKSRIDMFKKYKKPLWITEFACADDPKTIHGNTGGSKSWSWQCKYMKEVVPYLEKEDTVHRYSWFSGSGSYVGESKLFDGRKETELGKCYRDIPRHHGSDAEEEFQSAPSLEGVTDVIV